MELMSGPSRFSPEQRAKAVRMVGEATPNHPSQWGAIESVAAKVGVSSETLRKWVRQAEVDGGRRPGLTCEEAAEIKKLRRENAELRRANEILKAAAAFFGAELDRPQQRW
jgi:transposase